MLCAAALAGFLLPAINIEIEFFGNTRNISLGIRSLFDRPKNPFGDMGAGPGFGSDVASRLADLDLFDFSGGVFNFCAI